MGSARLGCSPKQHNGPEILKDQDAQGEPTGQGIEFEFFIQEFDDDGGAAQGQAGGQVEEVIAAADDLDAENGIFTGAGGLQSESQKIDKTQAQGGAEDELENPGDNQGLAGCFDLFETQLQADHKEEQDQADFGDGLDFGFIPDPGKAHFRPDNDPGGEIRQD